MFKTYLTIVALFAFCVSAFAAGKPSKSLDIYFRDVSEKTGRSEKEVREAAFISLVKTGKYKNADLLRVAQGQSVGKLEESMIRRLKVSNYFKIEAGLASVTNQKIQDSVAFAVNEPRMRFDAYLVHVSKKTGRPYEAVQDAAFVSLAKMRKYTVGELTLLFEGRASFETQEQMVEVLRANRDFKLEMGLATIINGQLRNKVKFDYNPAQDLERNALFLLTADGRYIYIDRKNNTRIHRAFIGRPGKMQEYGIDAITSTSYFTKSTTTVRLTGGGKIVFSLEPNIKGEMYIDGEVTVLENVAIDTYAINKLWE